MLDEKALVLLLLVILSQLYNVFRSVLANAADRPMLPDTMPVLPSLQQEHESVSLSCHLLRRSCVFPDLYDDNEASSFPARRVASLGTEC